MSSSGRSRVVAVMARASPSRSRSRSASSGSKTPSKSRRTKRTPSSESPSSSRSASSSSGRRRSRETYLTMTLKAVAAQQRGPTQKISRDAIKGFIEANLLDGKPVHVPSLRKALQMAETQGMVERVQQSFRVTATGREMAGGGKKGASKGKSRVSKKSDAEDVEAPKKKTKKPAAPTSKKKSGTSSSLKKKSKAKGASGKKRSSSTAAKRSRAPVAAAVRQRKKVAKTFSAQLKATEDLYLEQAEERGRACRACMHSFFAQYKNVTHLLYDHTVRHFCYRLEGDAMAKGPATGACADDIVTLGHSPGGSGASGDNGASSDDAGIEHKMPKKEQKAAALRREQLRTMDAGLFEFVKMHDEALGELFGSNTTWTIRPDAGGDVVIVAGNRMSESVGGEIAVLAPAVAAPSSVTLAEVAAEVAADGAMGAPTNDAKDNVRAATGEGAATASAVPVPTTEIDMVPTVVSVMPSATMEAAMSATTL